MKKKILALLLVIVMVVGLLPTSVFAAETHHTCKPWEQEKWSQWSEDTATCTEGGTITRTCQKDNRYTYGKCGFVQTQETNAKGHTAPNAEGKCDRCKTTLCNHDFESADTTLNNDGDCSACKQHIHLAGITVNGTPATCTEPGAQPGKKCVFCGVICEGGEEIPANGHGELDNDGICPDCGEHICFFGKDVAGKDATCTEAGVAPHKACSYNCGKTEGYAETEALGHLELDNDGICGRCGEHFCSMIDVVGKDATCKEAGYVPYKKCAYPKCAKVEGYKEIPALEHELVLNEKLSYPATCISEGLEVYTCENCDEFKQKVLPVDEENHREYKENKLSDPTCTEAGKIEWKCNACEKHGFKEIPAFGHDWELVKTLEAPKCGVEGKGTYVCANDDKHKKDDTIAALDHIKVEKVEIEPTCGKEGLNVVTCEREGCELKAKFPIPATGKHTYVVDLQYAPTCDKAGLEWHKCEVCGDFKEVEIPALEHIKVEKVEIEPTCDKVGLNVVTCEREGCELKAKFDIPALGHDWELKRTLKAPTCTEDGEGTYVCSRDDQHKKDDIIPAIGHDYEVVQEKKATCTEDGFVTYVCANDELHKYTEVIKGGHKTTEETLIEATCTSKGVVEWTCEVCGAYDKYETEMLKHDFSEKKVIEATCTETGLIIPHCAECGKESPLSAQTPALGHEIKDGKCTRCDYVEPKVEEPTEEPKEEPTVKPTEKEEPTVKPTEKEEPTVKPTEKEEPTVKPTEKPAETTKPADPALDNVPKTGDNTGMILATMTTIALLSAMAFVFGKKRSVR